MCTCLHHSGSVPLAISPTGVKMAIILKNAKLSSLRRNLGRQTWFSTNGLLVIGSSQSQSSFVHFYSFPLHHHCKYQKVLIVKKLTPPKFLQ